ncbi:hypothetical protein ACM25N_14475 [Roseovarius sp. C7]
MSKGWVSTVASDRQDTGPPDFDSSRQPKAGRNSTRLASRS